MPRFFEIANELEVVLAQHVDPETGEITEEAFEQITELELDRDLKALNVALYIKGERLEADKIEAQADVLRKEAAKLSVRAAVHSNRAESLHDYLERYLPEGHALANDRVAIKWRKAPPRVEITDAKAVPMECCTLPSPQPSKQLLKAKLQELDEGEELAYAKLAGGEQRMRVE